MIGRSVRGAESNDSSDHECGAILVEFISLNLHPVIVNWIPNAVPMSNIVEEDLEKVLVSSIEVDVLFSGRSIVGQSTDDIIGQRCKIPDVLDAVLGKGELDRGCVVPSKNIVKDVIECTLGLCVGEDHRGNAKVLEVGVG